MQIVIIDDNPKTLLLMTSLVGKLGHCRAVPFNNGGEALGWCMLHDPDMVLVDYRMPGMDGLDFIRSFRGRDQWADVPVIMITADESKDVRYRALELGATDFLAKPIDVTEFIARLRNMIALRRANRALTDRAAWLAEEVDKATRVVNERERELILRLSRAAEYRDPETGAHLTRMAAYADIIARNLDLPDREMLVRAAPMHDLGKVGIADNILLKPERLTPEEFAQIQRHPQIGYDILRDSSSQLMQIAAEIALTHHEKYDGSGYPQGLRGTQIPLHGRVIAVADVFDALTSERPYKPAWDNPSAITYLREQAGRHFDPACIEAFLKNPDEIEHIRRTYRD